MLLSNGEILRMMEKKMEQFRFGAVIGHIYLIN